MNKYKLNFLRFITHNEVPMELLVDSYDFKITEDGRFTFKCKARIDTSKFIFVRGCCD